MPREKHPTDLLLAHLDGALAPAQREAVSQHLAACADCAGERELLAHARTLLRDVAAEPRPGFAGRVALAAAASRPSPLGAPWRRWAFGGGLAVAGLAVVLVFALGRGAHGPAPSEDLRVAQRLELYEDLSVIQHQEALEDLDVVEVLHTLRPEGTP